MAGFKKENTTILWEKIPGSLRVVAICKFKLTFVVFSVSELYYKHGLLDQSLGYWGFERWGLESGKALILREWKVPCKKGGAVPWRLSGEGKQISKWR